MSRATPRKARHRAHPSVQAIAASDYESDAVHYLEARDLPPPAALPPRTNTDLNLSVLRRYSPSIRSIISIAANAVVYNFAAATQSWEKSGLEGTLFVCEQAPDEAAGGGPRACVFVLNRRGLENLVVDLAMASACEVSGELIMFNVENRVGGEETAASEDEDEAGGAGDGKLNVIGVWIHADEDDTREVNAAIIQDTWRQVRMATSSVPAAEESVEMPEQSQSERVAGRRLSISDLFGQKRNGTGR